MNLDFLNDTPGAALIFAAFVIASLVGLFRAQEMVARNVFRPYWLVPQKEWHTLFTSGFLHADLAHLFFNGFTFCAFAFMLEQHIGTGRFVALYVVGLLVSDLGTWFAHRTDPDYRTLGASGAILALLFASVIYFPSASFYVLPLPVPIPAPLFAFGYLAYSYWAARQNRGGINHDAHLTGALAGIAFVALTDPEAVGAAARAFSAMVG
jgi:membrane associated rhomboid family serine protease